jgi:hypothetical protein
MQMFVKTLTCMAISLEVADHNNDNDVAGGNVIGHTTSD